MTAVIIIFGAAIRPNGAPSGAMRNRVATALAAAETLERPEFMPTGGQGRFGPPEAELMADMLAQAGIERDRIRPVPAGDNTMRSALACARSLRGGAEEVYVATSAYHLARCVLLLRIAGVAARPCRPTPVPASTRGLKRWYWRLREVAAVPVDSALMLCFRLRGWI